MGLLQCGRNCRQITLAIAQFEDSGGSEIEIMYEIASVVINDVAVMNFLAIKPIDALIDNSHFTRPIESLSDASHLICALWRTAHLIHLKPRQTFELTFGQLRGQLWIETALAGLAE